MIVAGRVSKHTPETHTEFATARSFYPKSKPDHVLTAYFRERTVTFW